MNLRVMEPEVAVVLLVGLPGSGKSTLCRALLERQCPDFDIVHLEVDTWLPDPSRASVTPIDVSPPSSTEGEDQIAISWKSQRESILSRVRAQVEQRPSAERSLVVLVDDNMYYRSMRYSVYQLARKGERDTCPHPCDTEHSTMWLWFGAP